MNVAEILKNILESWGTSTETLLPKVILAIVVFLIFVLLGRIAREIILRIYGKLNKKHPDITRILSGCIYFFFILSGAFIALEIIGLEKLLTKLIASAGIAGIVAGFAFKDIASNAFAGLLLKTNHPFKRGDWIQFRDKYGKVSDITLMTTSIKNIFGQLIFIPNQLIYNDTFTNFSTCGKRRVSIKSGVAYGSDLEHVKEAAIDEIKKSNLFLTDEPVDFYYTEIGDSSFNFELLYWIKFNEESEYHETRSNAIINIKKRFEKENISIA